MAYLFNFLSFPMKLSYFVENSKEDPGKTEHGASLVCQGSAGWVHQFYLLQEVPVVEDCWHKVTKLHEPFDFALFFEIKLSLLSQMQFLNHKTNVWYPISKASDHSSCAELRA